MVCYVEQWLAMIQYLFVQLQMPKYDICWWNKTINSLEMWSDLSTSIIMLQQLGIVGYIDCNTYCVILKY